ncbi:HpcH/HpaI aldolase family protein [Phyllobacterium sp. K27]
MSEFRQRCLTRERMIGSFAAIPHPIMMEVIASAGVDFLCIDAEHSQIDRAMIENLVRACDAHRLPAMVRVPSHDAFWMASVLDAGAAGILIPRVSTAAQAEVCVMNSRYPPQGIRGIGPGRASGFGYQIADYLDHANERTVLALQIETAEGLANADSIAAVDGVDIVFIGPGDLAVSIGAGRVEGSAALNAAIIKIANAAQMAEKPVGIFCSSPADVGKWSKVGISFYVLGNDAMFLRDSLASATVEARSL